MAQVDYQYNALAKSILNDGFRYTDKTRNNIGMLQIPTHTLIIDMDQGFPLLTTKKIFWKSIIHELIWMLSGSTNIDYLRENNVKIWDQDAHYFSSGTEVGRIYGAQWRKWTSKEKPIDQIDNLIANLKKDRFSRNHIVTTWNPAELSEMALLPCHWAFEIVPVKHGGFCLKWYQRSCDTFLGIPFDIGLYATLGKLIERETGIPFKYLVGQLSNAHFYEPHISLIKMQLYRPILPGGAELHIDPSANFNDLSINDFTVENYVSNPAIKAKMYAKQ